MDGKKYISAKYASDNVALAFNDLHDLRHILLAGVVVKGFYHHANDRFGAGLTNQNTSGIAQRFCNCLDCLLYRRVVLCGLFASQDTVTGATYLEKMM